MNIYSNQELDPVEIPAAPEVVETPVTPEPVKVDVCDKIAELLVTGGELSIECTTGEFNKAHYKFKAERRSRKLTVTYRDGVLNASARL